VIEEPRVNRYLCRCGITYLKAVPSITELLEVPLNYMSIVSAEEIHCEDICVRLAIEAHEQVACIRTVEPDSASRQHFGTKK
jgi:hypothetical protein